MTDHKTWRNIEESERLPAQPQWHVRAWHAFRDMPGSGSIALFGAVGLSGVVAYVYQALMARFMAPSDYGLLVTLTSVSYVLDAAMRTIQAAIIKAVTAVQEGRRDHVASLLTVALRKLAPLAVLAFLAQWLLRGQTAAFFRLETTMPMTLLAIYASVSLLIPIPRGLLLGLDRAFRTSFIVVLEPLARLGLGMLLIILGLGVNGALLGYAGGTLLAFGVGLVLVRATYTRLPAGPTSGEGESDQVRFRAVDRYAVLVLIVNVCLMAMASMDQIAIRHFFSAEITGNYAIAFVLGRIIVMTAIAVGIIVFTRSAIMEPADPARASLLLKGLLAMGGIGLLATVAFMAAPQAVVAVMGGEKYGSAQAFVGPLGIAMTLFALVYVQTSYQISLKEMRVLGVLCVAVLAELGLIWQFHNSVYQVLMILVGVMGALLIPVSILSWRLVHPPTAKPRPSPAPDSALE